MRNLRNQISQHGHLIALPGKVLLSLTFPQYCPVCGNTWTGNCGFMCDRCWRDLPLAGRKTSGGCLDGNYRHIITYTYNSITRMLVHQMKFFGRKDIAVKFGQMAALFLKKYRNDFKLSTVVPVPLHPVRVRERGYDQNLEIARSVSECLKLELRTDLIKRIRNTRPQSRLTENERKVNLAGAFTSITTDNPNPKNTVLLIDDILHSGATLLGCIRALEERGINDIVVAAICG